MDLSIECLVSLYDSNRLVNESFWGEKRKKNEKKDEKKKKMIGLQQI